jgi:hypothetical protein
MAETIDYKVRIDTSSLADQLQQVKNQVDQAMATYTFRTAMPDPQPQAYSFPEAQYAQQYQPGIGVSAGQAIDTGRQMVQQDLNSMYQSTRLGFHKFSQDAMNIALMSSLGVPRNIPNYAEVNMPSFGNQGPWGIASSMLGAGYNPQMALGAGDYMRYAQNAFADNAIRNTGHMMGNTLGGMAGGAIGNAFLGPLGGIAGNWLGGKLGGAINDVTYGAFAATVGQDYDAYTNMRGAARDTSWRFLSGRFTQNQAADIAQQAVHYGRDESLIGRRVGLSDVQQTMKSYTEAGGFDFVHNASEFSAALKTVVESITQGSQSLRMSRDEYSRWHTQMGRMGLVGNTQEAMGLQVTLAAQALGAGYTAQELSQFGMQTAEMVRGTGISMGSAFIGGTQILSDLKAMARTGGISTEAIQQLGGFENAAATMARTGYQFGQSSAGLTWLAAESAGVNGMNSSPQGMMLGAIGRLNSPEEYMRFKGSMAERLSGRSPEEMFSVKTAMDIRTLSMLMGHPPDREQFLADRMNNGVDRATAQLQWSTAQSASARNASLSTANATAANIAATSTGALARSADIFTNSIAESTEVQTIAHGARNLDYNVNEIARQATNLWTGLFYGYQTHRTGGPADHTAMSDKQLAKELLNSSYSDTRFEILRAAQKKDANFKMDLTEESLEKGLSLAGPEMGRQLRAGLGNIQYDFAESTHYGRTAAENARKFFGWTDLFGVFSGTAGALASAIGGDNDNSIRMGKVKSSTEYQAALKAGDVQTQLALVAKEFTKKSADDSSPDTTAKQGGQKADERTVELLNMMWQQMRGRGINVIVRK